MNFLTAFEKFEDQNPAAHESAKLLRKSAAMFLQEKGLPTRKIENWKYTSLKSLSENTFYVDGASSSLPKDVLLMIESHKSGDFFNIVFFNGQLQEQLSDVKMSGVKISRESIVSDGLIDFSHAQGDAYLHALSGLFFTETINLKFEAQTSPKKPIRVFHFYHSCGRPSLMTHPRLSLDIGANSKLNLVESHCGLENSRYFVNSLTEIKCDSNVELDYVFQQDQSETAIHMAQSLFSLKENVKLKALSLQTGSSLSRHNVDFNLTGMNSEVDLLGLSVLAREQHSDNKTVINHKVGQCTTRQLYKSILSGKARYVFSGKIKISHDAQKASSEQLNKNLLLSSEAEVDSEPQLEVEADDVKATHGSTVGQLSEEEIFYFNSRGISKQGALNLLSYGFAADIVDRVQNGAIKKVLDENLQRAFVKLSDGIGKQAKNLGDL